MRRLPFGIYIDNSNLLNLLKDNTGNLDFGGLKIHYGKLCKEIESELRNTGKLYFLKKFMIYDGIVINDEEKKKRKENFIKSIKRKIKELFPSVNFNYELSPVELGSQKHLKGNDIALAIDVVTDILRGNVILAVIVSADGDFFILKERLGERIKFAWFRGMERGLNRKIKEAKPLWIDLESVRL